MVSSCQKEDSGSLTRRLNGANYQVLSELLQRDAWGAQYVANEALDKGFSSELIQYVAN